MFGYYFSDFDLLAYVSLLFMVSAMMKIIFGPYDVRTLIRIIIMILMAILFILYEFYRRLL